MIKLQLLRLSPEDIEYNESIEKQQSLCVLL